MNQPLGPIKLPINSGSLGIWLYQVARHLAGSHAVTVYSRHVPGLPETETDQGVRHRRIKPGSDPLVARALEWVARVRGPAHPAFASDRYYRSYIGRIAAEIAAEGADVVFAFNFAQFIPVLKAACPSAKVVLDMQCEWMSQLDREWCARRIRSADLILGCSEYITGMIKERFPEAASRCGTVFNGVDTEHFSGVQKKAAEGGDGQKIIFVGRVSPEKAVHDLIEAFAEASREFPGASLDIVGPEWVAPKEYIVGLSRDEKVSELDKWYRAPYGQLLRSLAEERGVGGKVRFVGNVAHEKLLDIYRSAAVSVNPSVSEAFGATLIEAMASGLPVIGCRVGGMTEIIEDGKDGFLVEGGNPRALAKALGDLLRDPARRRAMGDAGRRKTERVYAWEKITESLLSQYARVVPAAADAGKRTGRMHKEGKKK